MFPSLIRALTATATHYTFSGRDGEKRLPLERKELLGQLLLDEIVTRYDEKIDVKILDPRVGQQFPLPTYATSGSAGTCEPVSTTP